MTATEQPKHRGVEQLYEQVSVAAATMLRIWL